MQRFIHLIRHPEVAIDFKGICYGQMDIPLTAGWQDSLSSAVAELAKWPIELRPTAFWHSDLQRTRDPAHFLAQAASKAWQVVPLKVLSAADLRERFYGAWQGQRWDEINHEEVMQVHDTIYQPDSYRPGGGETTTEVQNRAVRWLERVRDLEPKNLVAIAHCGTIAAIAGAIRQLPATEWTPFYIQTSATLSIELPSPGTF